MKWSFMCRSLLRDWKKWDMNSGPWSEVSVTTILPRLNRVPRVPDVGSAYRLSPQSPVSESLRNSLRVSQMIFKLGK